jgi:hypothetical protein
MTVTDVRSVKKILNFQNGRQCFSPARSAFTPDPAPGAYSLRLRCLDRGQTRRPGSAENVYDVIVIGAGPA